jgi:L-ribulose-5-phosphate 3-epimerase UlaE
MAICNFRERYFYRGSGDFEGVFEVEASLVAHGAYLAKIWASRDFDPRGLIVKFGADSRYRC